MFPIILYMIVFWSIIFSGRAYLRVQTNQAVVRFPYITLILMCIVGLPSILQIFVSSLFTALSGDPIRTFPQWQLWRVITALFVQDGGLFGTLFNLLLLLVTALNAERIWGDRLTLLIFFGCGMILNIVGLLFGAAVAGNSGATFALGASCTARILLQRASGWVAALICLATGVLLVVLHNPHGIAILFGAGVGSIITLLQGQHNRKMHLD